MWLYWCVYWGYELKYVCGYIGLSIGNLLVKYLITSVQLKQFVMGPEWLNGYCGRLLSTSLSDWVHVLIFISGVKVYIHLHKVDNFSGQLVISV